MTADECEACGAEATENTWGARLCRDCDDEWSMPDGGDGEVTQAHFELWLQCKQATREGRRA